MTARPLLIIGAGGLSRETLSAVTAINAVSPQWTVLGFVDDNPALHGHIIDGLPVLGPSELVAEHQDAAVVMTIASPRPRSPSRPGLRPGSTAAYSQNVVALSAIPKSRAGKRRGAFPRVPRSG